MFVVKEIEGTPVLQNEALLQAGLQHGWYGAELGNTMYRTDSTPEEVDAVKERWSKGCQLLGMTASRLVRATGLLQTDKVLYVPEEATGPIGEADGYVLDTPGQPIMMRSADCTTSVILDPKANILGVVHAGGLGMARGVLRATILKMQAKGANPRDMLVGIGPAISPDYFMPTREKDNFTLHDIADTHPVTKELAGGRIGYDIGETGRRQLLLSDIPEENIAVSGIDTFTSTKGRMQFYSFERNQGDPIAMRQKPLHAMFASLAA